MKPKIKKRSEYCGEKDNMVKGKDLKRGCYYRTPRTGNILFVVEAPPSVVRFSPQRGWFEHYYGAEGSTPVYSPTPKAYYFGSNKVFPVKPDQYYEGPLKVTLVLEDE